MLKHARKELTRDVSLDGVDRGTFNLVAFAIVIAPPPDKESDDKQADAQENFAPTQMLAEDEDGGIEAPSQVAADGGHVESIELDVEDVMEEASAVAKGSGGPREVAPDADPTENKPRSGGQASAASVTMHDTGAAPADEDSDETGGGVAPSTDKAQGEEDGVLEEQIEPDGGTAARAEEAAQISFDAAQMQPPLDADAATTRAAAAAEQDWRQRTRQELARRESESREAEERLAAEAEQAVRDAVAELVARLEQLVRGPPLADVFCPLLLTTLFLVVLAVLS